MVHSCWRGPIRSSFLLALALLSCGEGATDPGNEEMPLGPPQLTVGAVTGLVGKTETSMAINPKDPARVALAFQVPNTVAWSTDSGRTWQSQRVPGMDAYSVSGDPIVFYDADGHLYSMAIAFDPPGDYRTLGRLARRNSILINRSDDGGATWRPKATEVVAQPDLPGVPFEDKPAAAVDVSSDNARRGTVHVAWTEFRLLQSGIRYARSTDGGVSFSAPIEISDKPGAPNDTVGAAEGTDVAIGPDGTVYVVWSDSVGVWIDRSADGGRTFGADVLVARTRDMFFVVPGVYRANGFPSIDVDAQNGAVYVQWVDNRMGRYVPWLVKSADRGSSWSIPRPVIGGGVTATSDRFFSWLAVDRKTGMVVVGYYRSDLPGEMAYYLAASNNGGASFEEWRWSPITFSPGGAFIGDYTGLDVVDGVVHGAWTETGLSSVTGRQAAQVWAGRASFK